jgi:hypothetical protein
MSAHYTGVPRPKPGPQQTVVQLGAGDDIHCVVLSATIWGVSTHWNDRAGKHGRSERCTADRGECSGCHAELPSRWKGYLYVYCFLRRKAVFVELTPASAEAIELQMPSNESYRGQGLKLKRGDGGKKTRISVEVLEYRGDLAALPDDRDPEPILETLWNWRR